MWSKVKSWFGYGKSDTRTVHPKEPSDAELDQIESEIEGVISNLRDFLRSKPLYFPEDVPWQVGVTKDSMSDTHELCVMNSDTGAILYGFEFDSKAAMDKWLANKIVDTDLHEKDNKFFAAIRMQLNKEDLS